MRHDSLVQPLHVCGKETEFDPQHCPHAQCSLNHPALWDPSATTKCASPGHHNHQREGCRRGPGSYAPQRCQVSTWILRKLSPLLRHSRPVSELYWLEGPARCGQTSPLQQLSGGQSQAQPQTLHCQTEIHRSRNRDAPPPPLLLGL